MTATAVLDRTTTTRVGASSSSPVPTSFGDDEYARQLNQRLAENRSAKPRQVSANGGGRTDAAITNPSDVEPASTITAEQRAVGLQNIPLTVPALSGNDETADAELAEVASSAAAPADANSSSAEDSSQPRGVPSAPPVPWQRDAGPSAVPQRATPQTPEDLPPTAHAPASLQDRGSEGAADAAIPQGLVRANEVTTAHSRGIIAPPGLVVAINAAQQRSTQPAQDPGSDSASDAPQGNAPPADGSAIDTATSVEENVAAPVVAEGEAHDELPSTEKKSQNDAAVDQGNDSVPSSPNALNPSAVVTTQNAELPANNKAGATKDSSPSKPVRGDAAAAATQAVVSETASVEATTDVVKLEVPAANAAVSQKPAPADTPRNTSPARSGSEHRNVVDGRDHAAAVVADATVRADEAVESAPAAPSTAERAVAATQAVPAALHASLVERASDATDAPNAPVSDPAANATVDSGVSSIRSDAKPLAPSPTGRTVHTQHQSATNLADGLPRHAAAALRAAAGFDRPIRVRLSPAELGALQVEVGRHEGALHARFEVTTSAAQSMLHDHLPALRESLGRAGLVVDRIDVRLVETTQDDARSDSHSNSGGEQSNYSGQQHERGQSDDHQRSSRKADSDDALLQKNISTPKPVEIPVRRTIGSAADLIDIQI